MHGHTVYHTSLQQYHILLVSLLIDEVNILYRAPSNITDNDVNIFKALFAAVNVLFIITWLVASAFNKASITDMDLDPEELEMTQIYDDEDNE